MGNIHWTQNCMSIEQWESTHNRIIHKYSWMYTQYTSHALVRKHLHMREQIKLCMWMTLNINVTMLIMLTIPTLPSLWSYSSPCTLHESASCVNAFALSRLLSIFCTSFSYMSMKYTVCFIFAREHPSIQNQQTDSTRPKKVYLVARFSGTNWTLCLLQCTRYMGEETHFSRWAKDWHSMVALLIYRVHITENAILTTVTKMSDRVHTVQRAEQIEIVQRQAREQIFFSAKLQLLSVVTRAKEEEEELLQESCRVLHHTSSARRIVHILSVHFSLQFTFAHLVALFETKLRPPSLHLRSSSSVVMPTMDGQ